MGLLNLAHRYAYFETFGVFDPLLFVCHHCDNPPCCRPDHLFLGTNRENIDDRVQKDRSLRGDRATRHILTAAQVVTIRLRLGIITQKALAREFGVDPSTISNIATGRNWRE